MKSLKLIIIVLLMSGFAIAQNSKVQTAYNYMKYEEFDKAQVAIDEAAKNEATIGKAKTWVYRGHIYFGLLKSPKFSSQYPQAADEALLSYNKAMEIDPKNEWVDEIKINKSMILNEVFNKALVAYKAKEYEKALMGFEMVAGQNVKDTAVYFNCALAAEGAKNSEKAKFYYQKLIDMKYNSSFIYLGLAVIYVNEKNDEKATEVIEAGLALYPDNSDLMNMKMNQVYKKGNDELALKTLQEAIAKDPTNAMNYYNSGVLYSRLANPVDESGKAKAKPSNYNELMEKAIINYTKSIELKADYFDANYNLGALFFNQGAELINQANDLPPTKQKEYDALVKKADDKFKASEPYFEKAYQLNPKDNPTLQSLKQLYVRTGETDKYNKIKAELEGK